MAAEVIKRKKQKFCVKIVSHAEPVEGVPVDRNRIQRIFAEVDPIMCIGCTKAAYALLPL